MSIRTLISLLAVTGLALACEQQPAEETGETMEPTEATVDVAAEEQAIHDLTNRYEQAWAAKDVEALSTMWADDAVWTEPEGAQLSGVQELRDEWTQHFANTTTQSAEINPTETVIASSGDIAYEIGSYTARGTMTDGTALEETHRYLVTYRKDDGAWKLVYGMVTAPLAPEGGTAAGR